MDQPLIILLNGTSSAGKTSIAKKIQEIYPEPILHFGIDHFFFSLDPRYVGKGEEAHLGFQFIDVDDNLGPKRRVKTGLFGKQIIRAMRKTLRGMVEEKINLIIDDLFFNETDMEEYLDLFKGVKVYFFSIKPPLEIAEKWERMRGDRDVGLARGLYEIVYQNKAFDLEIDNSIITPGEAAQQILDHIFAHRV